MTMATHQLTLLRLPRVCTEIYVSRFLTGSAALLEDVPNASTSARLKPLRTLNGRLRLSAQKATGRMSAPKIASPDNTVASHAPSAPSVPSNEHARQMAAAISDAMPSGLVHSTAVTMRLITALNACVAKSS